MAKGIVLLFDAESNRGIRACWQRLEAAGGRDAHGVWEHYVPENWVPHCTVAGDLSEQQSSSAIDMSRTAPPPAAVSIVAAALIDSETGDMRLLHEHAAATAST